MTEPPTTGPLLSPGFALHRAALAWRAELARRLSGVGLTPTRFMLLAGISFLGYAGRPPTQQEASDFAGIDKMMTSRLTAGLVDAGLLERRRDGAAVRLHLTGPGREAVDTGVAIAKAVDQDFFGDGAGALRERLIGLPGSRP